MGAAREAQQKKASPVRTKPIKQPPKPPRPSPKPTTTGPVQKPAHPTIRRMGAARDTQQKKPSQVRAKPIKQPPKPHVHHRSPQHPARFTRPRIPPFVGWVQREKPSKRNPAKFARNPSSNRPRIPRPPQATYPNPVISNENAAAARPIRSLTACHSSLAGGACTMMREYPC